MDSPTRDEVDAKLQLIETRMDGRVASIESSIHASIIAANETRGEIKNLKWTTIVTAIATVWGIAAFNATVLSNMVASFESGKNTAAAQAEVGKQSEEIAALIRKMQDDLDARRTDTAEKSKPRQPAQRGLFLRRMKLTGRLLSVDVRARTG